MPQAAGSHWAALWALGLDVLRFGFVEGVACGDAALRAGVATEEQIAAAVERASGFEVC